MTVAEASALVEFSGENLPLAEAELDGALAALGGRRSPTSDRWSPTSLCAVQLPTPAGVDELGRRLGLARRVLRPFPTEGRARLMELLQDEGAHGRSAAFRPVGAARGPLDPSEAGAFAAAYVRGGGSINLRSPERRFVVGESSAKGWWVAEEASAQDRGSWHDRRMPQLPFQRPVSLAPKLGRAAANLARLRVGDRVVDPFLGTGALLIEAALLGAKVSGVDRDDEMVRGALQNFEHVGVQAEELRVGDAANAFPPRAGGAWDAVLTDPPYGRSSGSGGEPPDELVRRVLPPWAELVRPGGVVVIVLPDGAEPLPPPWVSRVRVPDRVHRSLTREFCVYGRKGDEFS